MIQGILYTVYIIFKVVKWTHLNIIVLVHFLTRNRFKHICFMDSHFDDTRFRTLFQNVQVFGEIFSKDIQNNTMIFLKTRKGLKSYYIRLHVIEGKKQKFELGMILLFAARLGCLYGSDDLSEEEFEDHVCDLEEFVRGTKKRKQFIDQLIDKIGAICNNNIDWQTGADSS